MLLSPADWVVAVTPLVNTPELEVKEPNNVSLAAISTESTKPVTTRFPLISAPVVLTVNLCVILSPLLVLIPTNPSFTSFCINIFELSKKGPIFPNETSLPLRKPKATLASVRLSPLSPSIRSI